MVWKVFRSRQVFILSSAVSCYSSNELSISLRNLVLHIAREAEEHEAGFELFSISDRHVSLQLLRAKEGVTRTTSVESLVPRPRFYSFSTSFLVFINFIPLSSLSLGTPAPQIDPPLLS